MAVIPYKSIRGCRQRRRAAAAAQGEQRLSPDDPQTAQETHSGASQPTDGSAVARMSVPHTLACGSPAGAATARRAYGQAAKAVAAAIREPAAGVAEGTGQVSRPALIEVRGLRKSYDGAEAVAGIDLEVRAGEISRTVTAAIRESLGSASAPTDDEAAGDEYGYQAG